MLSHEDVRELLMNDRKFKKLPEEDKKHVVEMTVGKIEQFILEVFPEPDPETIDSDWDN